MSKIKIFFTIFSLLFLISFWIYAVEIKNPLQYSTLDDLIKALIGFLKTLALALVPVVIIIGGYYIMTAGGNPDKVKTGKNIIIYALIALVIILLAKDLVDIIKGIIGVK
jgi:hypothetical protein